LPQFGQTVNLSLLILIPLYMARLDETKK